MSPEKMEKILVVALPGIGDALMATPMIELLRKAKPDAEIHALVMFAATKEMFETDPFVDQVHYCDFIKGPKGKSLQMLFALRKLKFDISINIYPQNRREYNLIALAIGAKRRLGVLYRRQGKRNLNWINTDWLMEDDLLHCVEENVRLLSCLKINHRLEEEGLPKLRLNLSKAHDNFAENWLAQKGITLGTSQSPLIGIHAGTALFKNHIQRRWAPENFAALARKLRAEQGATILLFGGPDDVSANEVILREAGQSVIPVVTKNLLDSVAVMKKLDLFVSNDSSLMHIAGGLSLPVVAIFGPTNEVYVHPWKTRYEIVQTGIDCRPCFVYSPKPLTCYRENPAEHFMCIREIEVDQVFSATEQLLSEAKGGYHPLPII